MMMYFYLTNFENKLKSMRDSNIKTDHQFATRMNLDIDNLQSILTKEHETSSLQMDRNYHYT